MAISKDYVVVAVHGEGDREALLMSRLADLPPGLDPAGKNAIIDQRRRDLAPDVVVVLASPDKTERVELRLNDWDEVEALKGVVGFDTSPHPADQLPMRHWVLGGTVRVTFEKVEA